MRRRSVPRPIAQPCLCPGPHQFKAGTMLPFFQHMPLPSAKHHGWLHPAVSCRRLISPSCSLINAHMLSIHRPGQ
jgi:hypothetical protein